MNQQNMFIVALVGLIILANGMAIDRLGAATSAPVDLRLVQAEGGQRLLIEWDAPIKVLQKRDDQHLILRFSRPLSIDGRSVIDRLGAYLDINQTKIEGNDLDLVLKKGTKASLEIKKRRIVQIHLSRAQQNPFYADINVSPTNKGVRLSIEWPNLSSFDTIEQTDKLSVTFNTKNRFDPSIISHLNNTLKPWFSELRSTEDLESTSLIFDLQPMIVSSVSKSGNNRVFIDLERNVNSLKDRLEVAVLPAFRPKGLNTTSIQSTGPLPTLPEPRPYTIGNSVENHAAETADTKSQADESAHINELLFDWSRKVDAAIFKRAGYLWVAFDAPQSLLNSSLPSPPSSLLGPGSVVPNDNAMIVRFPMASDVDLSVQHRNGMQWTIRLGSPAEASSSIAILPGEKPDTLYASEASNGRVLHVTDPLVGDEIGIWPISQSHLGQSGRRRFVDFEVLPSIQGLVWRKLNDGMTANAIDGGIQFNSKEGLSLSSWANLESIPTPEIKQEPDNRPKTPSERENPKVQLEGLEHSTQSPASFFDLAGYRPDQDTKTRRHLRRLIGTSSSDERDQHRLELAKLLIAKRHAQEAKTVLSSLSNDIEGAAATSKRALWGASALLAGDLEEASSILNAPEFDDDEEIGIWRTALGARENDRDSTAAIWEANRELLDIYPPKLRLMFGLLALEAAIKSDDDNMIRVGFRRLKTLDMQPREIAQVDRLHALRAIRDGDFARAEEILHTLTDRKFGALSLRAELELASLSISAKSNDPDLLETLEGQLPLWRGHPQEIDLINSLAGWYRAANEPRKALELWERLSGIHPKTDVDPVIRGPREATFAEALTELAGDKISLFDAYTIYLDFLELLPDEAEKKLLVHRNLAEHLSNLDLLGEAVNFLLPLIDKVGDKTIREEIGVEIATLLLLQNRPQEALSALDRTKANGINNLEDRNLEQQLIRAQAFVQLGRFDDALKQIQGVQTHAARHVRANALWKERKWARLARAIESFLKGANFSHPLGHEDKKLVLWLALSWDHLGQVKNLRDLRQRYASEMAVSPWAEVFAVSTQTKNKRGDIPSVLAQTAEQLAELRNFRERAKTAP